MKQEIEKRFRRFVAKLVRSETEICIRPVKFKPERASSHAAEAVPKK
jgi:hypothetical protein